MGKRAAAYVQDGDTIIIDTGTTVMELAKSIQYRNRLTARWMRWIW
ncbi:hypothetical protein [Brevibacillus sp. H7]